MISFCFCPRTLLAGFLLTLTDCSELGGGASVVAIFTASILAMMLYSFIERWVRRDFRRPPWLEAGYQVAFLALAASVLLRALQVGDWDTLMRIGGASFAAGGIGLMIEAIWGLRGAQTDLDIHDGRWLAVVGLGGLVAASLGLAAFVSSY